MSPSSTDKTSANGTNDKNRVTSRPNNTAIDGSKVNELMEHLLHNLSGGLHGEFFEEGSKLDDKNRHGQIKAVFALTEQLSKMNGYLQRQQLQAESDQNKAGRCGTQGSKNQIATIASIVQQQVSEKLRDLSIRNERLESDLMELKKAAEKSGALEAKVKALEAQLKKAEGRCQTSQQKLQKSVVDELQEKREEILSDIAVAERTVADAERSVAIRKWQDSKHDRAVELNVSSIPVLTKCVIRLEGDLERQADRLNHLEGRVACKVPLPYSRIPFPKTRVLATPRRLVWASKLRNTTEEHIRPIARKRFAPKARKVERDS